MEQQRKAIGVFDSGLGGISVLHELRKHMPNEDFIYFGDSAYAPYGEKKRDEITKRCRKICDFFITKGVKAIVIACNTATSACVDELRLLYDLPIIGMEPAIKVAADLGENQTIIVMATHFTLREKKFVALMERCCKEHTLIRIPCPELVNIVEQDALSDKKRVRQQLQSYFEDVDLNNVHSVVLGCTHFVFFTHEIRALLPSHIQIIDGNAGTAHHVYDILHGLHAISSSTIEGRIVLYNSSKDTYIMDLAGKLLGNITTTCT